MKKMITKYLSMFSMLLFATLAVTSCSNDKDEPDSIAEQLVGTWVASESDQTLTLKFNSDGTGADIWEKYSPDGEEHNGYVSFRWTATDEELTLKYEDGEIYTDSYDIDGDYLYWDGSEYEKQ